MDNSDAVRVTAVLGPTNTGKTHLAIERMLGHASGMMGFPLRLLARENYDRVVARLGRNHVALITGEDKVIPAQARYFLCTVEAMPTDRKVAFLAIDEVQMAGDRERGHVFTNRILTMRGTSETMLLGARTIQPLLRKLVPDAEYVTRSRFSKLSYTGARKITRLPRRSAVIAFSASDVYALAELVRHQRGGAAVVLGALSPRTRNAQVAMYQAGEVDYLIATDAIGMGLNMDIDHIAFAEDAKFDGRMPRRLVPQELAQIAGRAGRHMKNGTFGVTGGCPAFEGDVVAAIEDHFFEPLRGLYWRNSDLSFRSLRDLRRSLDHPPPWPFLMRKRDAGDHRALETLGLIPEIRDRANTRSRVQLLWEVCQVPDFRKTLTESHIHLLTRLFSHLTSPDERLPDDLISCQMKRFDRTDGDIDTLAGRIAHIRTWTYIAHHGGWVADPVHWQQMARTIEDRLSDALHDRLTQQFVDRRAAVLVRKLRDSTDLMAAIRPDGDVTVEGYHVGNLEGLTFVPDTLSGSNAKPVLAAARRILPAELARRVNAIRLSDDEDFELDERGAVLWRGSRIAAMSPGGDPMSPRIRIKNSDLVGLDGRRVVEQRLTIWLENLLSTRIPELVRLRDLATPGPVRGVFFQLTEWLGTVPRSVVNDLIEDLDEGGRRSLADFGVRFGTESVFLPALLKPRASGLLTTLWCVFHQRFLNIAPPPGRVTVERRAGVPDGFYCAAGYIRLGGQVIRADMTERLAAVVRRRARRQPFTVTPEMLSLAGVGHDRMPTILNALGYRHSGKTEGRDQFVRIRNGNQLRHAGRKPPAASGSSKRLASIAARRKDNADSPFAILRTMVPIK